MSTSAIPIQSSLLKVPGAQIYYEVEGTGPVLLMIPGGPTGAGIFAALGAVLADRYTVVRYDPRGNSRSVVNGPAEDQNMDVHGDDAAELLASFGDQPAFVLGSSGGAQIGLNLTARYPQRVKTLVAHEPPCIQLLPDFAELRAGNAVVKQIHREQGAGAAMQKFMAGAGLNGDAEPKRTGPPPAAMLEAFGRIQGNLDYFFVHGITPISEYLPDIDALRAGTSEVFIGVGVTSAEQLAGRSAIALADRLATVPIMFPGGHGGYNDDPAGFALKLHEALQGA
jgi:pimeloyl-ACP methyl ester carboxylesterase